MKKLLFLLPALLLAGCSLTPSPTPVSTQETSGTVVNDVSTFDFSKVENEGEGMDTYGVYKNILPYKNGYIGAYVNGQDGYEMKLVYTENGKVISFSMPIFWYDIGSTYKNVYEYCGEAFDGDKNINAQWTTSGVIGLDKCPLVTSLPINNENKWAPYKYLFDFIRGNDTNAYFSQKFQAFKDSL